MALLSITYPRQLGRQKYTLKLSCWKGGSNTCGFSDPLLFVSKTFGPLGEFHNLRDLLNKTIK